MFYASESSSADGFHWPDGVPKHVRIGPDRTFVKIPLTRTSLDELQERKRLHENKRTRGI